MIYILSEEEIAERKKFPAKEHISIPLRDVIFDTTESERQMLLERYQEAVKKWCESDEATKAALEVNKLFRLAYDAREKLISLKNERVWKEHEDFLKARGK